MGPLIDVKFPEPPIPEIEDCVVGLRSATELWSEAEEQKNCLASPSYVQQVLSGSLYLYSVQWPSRCTLAVGPNRTGGGWTIRQLRAACNQPVSFDTEDFVREWLVAARSSSIEALRTVVGRILARG